MKRKSKERAPIYKPLPDGGTDPSKRIVSAPGGLWLAQVRKMDKGTRERDCWYTFPYAPASKEDALRIVGYKS